LKLGTNVMPFEATPHSKV